MPAASVDLLVVGGGINGAAVARDAAGRGLSVMLAERDDYASGTSSGSTKLIHGGLRYLETFEFGLVRESLAERARLLRNAPHLVRPLRFLLPITAAQRRPTWQVWLGLKLYDLFAGSGAPGPSGRLSEHEIDGLAELRGQDLKSVLSYWDCQTDDARLVIAQLLDARALGADITNGREVTGIQALENGYRVALREDGSSREVDARFVVNAAGPWVGAVNALTDPEFPSRQLRLVRGSHLVLAMPMPAQQDAYTLQNPDGRVTFSIPWLDQRFLVVGTTEEIQDGDARDARCSEAERDYLLASYNRYFERPGGRGPVRAEDVLFDWSAVRALADDGAASSSKVTRSAAIDFAERGTGGFATLYGGKLTTHRSLAEKVMNRLARHDAGISGPWTADRPLHGGHLSRDKLEQMVAQGPDAIDPETRRRWAFTYGDQIQSLFDRIASDAAQAREVAPGVTEAELAHACEVEDARGPQDFLLRRTKLHYLLDQKGRDAVASWFAR